MSEEKRELAKEELEDIEWEKAGFTRTEIEEMDRRATENSIPWEEFIDEIFSQDEILEMDKRANDIGKVPSFTTDEILKELGYYFKE
ncbi:unknown [Fusobacterium sp. CAG:439]|nr:unknown [Fusobacterium sp. CAG:439]